MGVDTHRVEVVPVVLEPHPDPETTALSVVRVYNFTVVVRTEDWKGVEKAAYVQPDSVLPDKPEYRFLKITGNIKKELDALQGFTGPEADAQRAALEAKIDTNTKYLRITVRKLRGVMSMGMLLPLPEEFKDAEIGTDLADALGITHYEEPTEEEKQKSRRHQGDDVAPPPPSCIYAPSYDVESAYKYASLFEPGEMVYVTEKLDGQNARFLATDADNEWRREVFVGGQVSSVRDVTLHAGSRNEWKKKEGGSNWWRVQEQNEWIPQWCYNNQDRVLYGETFGWVAKLKYGAKQGQLFFRAFDVLDGTDWWDAEKFMAEFHESLRVPCLGIMPFNWENLVKLADGKSLIPGANNIREGIVIKPVKERKHWKLGRVFVKLVSNVYLEQAAR